MIVPDLLERTEWVPIEDLRAILHLLLAVKPKRMVEIGINHGMTARLVLQYVDSIEEYVGIDCELGYQTEIPEHSSWTPLLPGNLVGHDPRVSIIIRPHGSLDLAPEDIGACDAMFIDGDHGPRTVAHDTKLAQACVRTGGIIIWHDATCYGVPQVLETLGNQLQRVIGTDVAYQVAAH